MKRAFWNHLLILSLISMGYLCPCRAEQPEESWREPSSDSWKNEEVRSVSWPEREGMVFALDPGLALRMSDPKMLYARLHFRIGHCLAPWVSLGLDAQLDLLILSFDEERSVGGSKLMGLGLAFYPIEGWFLRAASGMDVTKTNVAYLSARTGYEWATERYAAVGLGITGTGLWKVPEKQPDWLLALTLTLTAYDLFNRFWLNDQGFQ